MLTRVWLAVAGVAAAALPLAVPSPAVASDGAPHVLVFTAAADADQAHASTPRAGEHLEMNGRRYGFTVEVTDDAERFTPESLAEYDVVVWLNTYGDVLDEQQQEAFHDWVKEGGGFVGVHGAARTEPDWGYFHELVGAFAVEGEDDPESTRTVTVDTGHPSTEGMLETWEDHQDQWYRFDRSPSTLPGMKVLATVPDSTSDAQHPVTWCRSVDDGRSWYTSLGHAGGTYQDGDFMRMLRGGILWAAGVEGPQTVRTDAAAPRWPYELSFLFWVGAVAVGGGVAVVRLNRREAPE
ncbi:MAG: ThuA domain-containing protein [Stackebrandtia sp.]